MRKSGILFHISSLPNDYGIGTMGKEAYEFVDYLEECGQSLWQILPLSPTSYGDSPYQSFSIFAGNPYFISFETLEYEGLLEKAEYADIKWRTDERYIDYGTIYDNIYVILKKAYQRFIRDGENLKQLESFSQSSPWLEDYALFMALKSVHGGRPWNEWERPLRMRDESALEKARIRYADEIGFQKFMQFKFTRQWERLKAYANDNGIQIIGDIPIYCAYDSCDVWSSPRLFELDDERLPTAVAGFPPDCFSADGQLWGNPLYNWQQMKAENFDWWTERVSYAKKLYDIVRIDHFIGFERYYAIPYGDKVARNGSWRQGPSFDLFGEIIKRTGKGGIIAEDLGIITPAVRRLLKRTGYPGMKVLQFAFDPEGKSEYMPQNYANTNCTVYTSTHDSDTVAGWVSTNSRSDNKFCREYLNVRRNADIPNGFIRLAWQSTADIAMTTIQELCGYGSEARINIPSTIGNNWRWRAIESDFSHENAAMLNRLTQICNRKEK